MILSVPHEGCSVAFRSCRLPRAFDVDVHDVIEIARRAQRNGARPGGAAITSPGALPDVHAIDADGGGDAIRVDAQLAGQLRETQARVRGGHAVHHVTV